MDQYIDYFRDVILAQAGYAATLLAILLAVSFVIKTIAKKVLQKASPASATLVSTLIQVLIIIIGLYLISIAIGIDGTAILACVAILTAGISLSADASFRDIIAGLKILMNKRLRPGDWVTVAGGITGVIREVGLSSTIIENNKFGLIVLSNHKITEDMVVNHSRLPNLELSVNIPMFDNHDRRRATEIIHLTLNRVTGWHGEVIVQHSWIIGTGENYEVIVAADSYDNRRQIASRISAEITSALFAENLPVGYASFIHNF